MIDAKTEKRLHKRINRFIDRFQYGDHNTLMFTERNYDSVSDLADVLHDLGLPYIAYSTHIEGCKVIIVKLTQCRTDI